MSDSYILEYGQLTVNAELIEENGSSKAVLTAPTAQVLDSRADLERIIRSIPGGSFAWFFLKGLIPSSAAQLPWQRTYLGCIDMSMDAVLTRVEFSLSRQDFAQHFLPYRKLGVNEPNTGTNLGLAQT